MAGGLVAAFQELGEGPVVGGADRGGERSDHLREMAEHLARRVSTYSSGMMQKLSRCRALLMDPVLLLLE